MEYYWWNLELFRVFPKRLLITPENSFIHKGGNIPHFFGGMHTPRKKGDIFWVHTPGKKGENSGSKLEVLRVFSKRPSITPIYTTTK